MDISIICWLGPTFLGMGVLGVSTLRKFWSRRRLAAEAALALLAVAGVFLLVAPLPWWTWALCIGVQLLLVLLAVRVMVARQPEAFLRASMSRSIVGAIGVVAFAGLAAWLTQEAMIYIITSAGLLVSLWVVRQAWWLRTHAQALPGGTLSLKDLPTVSLLIPARNETHALTECLTAAVASDYPKLEILVLDDCSHDNTSALIRSFAHDGVRFIQGKEPATGWLGKNQAMRTLAEQASGDYLLFCDVDTHVAPHSISQLVTYALSQRLQMVTVLPQRRDGLTTATALWPLRYFWQAIRPITARNVPTATQLWLINADTLRRLGGFGAVKQKITPESYFARQLHGLSAYRFVQSDNALAVTSAKRWSSQAESAIRFLYPTLRRQPLAVLLGGLTLITLAMLFVLPWVVWPQQPLVALLSATASGLLLVGYALIVTRALPASWPVALLILPLSLLQESVLLVVSLLQYEFGEVNWKGRNVCYPVIERPPSQHESHP